MQRYSKNREIILDCIKNTKEHPSADWVYSQLKTSYPDVSIATVYRNIAQLKEEGLVRSVGIVCGKERFDANNIPHTHAICRVCGRVIDVDGVHLPESIVQTVEDRTGFSISFPELRLTGVCNECKNNNSKGEN